jgi:hypothetical protein
VEGGGGARKPASQPAIGKVPAVAHNAECRAVCAFTTRTATHGRTIAGTLGVVLPRRPSRRVQCDRTEETPAHCNDAHPLKRMHTERDLARARPFAPLRASTVQVFRPTPHARHDPLHDRRAPCRRRALPRPELHLVELDAGRARANPVPHTSHRTRSAGRPPTRSVSWKRSRPPPCPLRGSSPCQIKPSTKG